MRNFVYLVGNNDSLAYLIHFNVLKRIFVVQLMIVSKICKRLSKNINEMQIRNHNKSEPIGINK